MTEKEYLLITLIEEAAEIQQAATKALRFGMDSRNPYNKESPTNEENLVEEFYQLAAMMEMLYSAGIVHKPSKEQQDTIMWKKKRFVERCIEEYEKSDECSVAKYTAISAAAVAAAEGLDKALPLLGENKEAFVQSLEEKEIQRQRTEAEAFA